VSILKYIPIQAEVKINAIYEAICDSLLWDVTCVRTKHTVSIHCMLLLLLFPRKNLFIKILSLAQYPFRAIQIVLRLYQSPAEILAGFDVDAPCCAYDGKLFASEPISRLDVMQVTVSGPIRGLSWP
jgi:hypothetical protein